MLAFFQSNAQSPTSSPYSRFGLGDFSSHNIFAQSAALGGTNIALKNDTLFPLFINPANPASFGSLKATTFEVGVNSIFNKFSNNTASSQGNNTTLNYLALGFPIRQVMGACLGVMPASSVGYKITEKNDVANIGTVTELYEGEGGVNSLFLGLGGYPYLKPYNRYMKSARLKKQKDDIRLETDTFNILYAQYQATLDRNDSISLAIQRQEIWTMKNDLRKKIAKKRWLSSFSVGGTGSYYFGTINNTSRVLFPNQANFFNTSQVYQLEIKDFAGNFGLQNSFVITSVPNGTDTVVSSPTYGLQKRRELKQNVEITWGYTYSMNNSLRSYYSNFAYTFLYKGNGINEILRDTVKYVENMRTNVTLPVMHGIGISIRKGSRLNILADYQMQLWSGFKYENESAQFTDMKRISVGMEYIPNKLTNTKGTYFKKVQYRIGARYNDGKMLINNQRVNEYAVSLGLGFPVGMYRALNTFNISVEAGQMGTKDLVQHQFIQAKLGFTFNDRWFIKYKYD